MNSKIIRIVLLAAAILAPGFAFADQKSVVLDVDGTRETVTTYAASPEDLLVRTDLAQSHEAIESADIISGGDIVKVRRPRTVVLVTDSGYRSVEAFGLTVGEALEHMGLKVEDGDLVVPAASTPLLDGMPLFVREKISVSVKADGVSREVVSSAPTVRALLAHASIKLGPADYSVPSLSSTPEQGATLSVVRVGTRTETKRIDVAFDVETERDAKLDRGKQRIAREGREGIREIRYRLTVENGKVTSRKLVKSEIVREPIDKIVIVGTRPPPPPFTSTGHSETGVASWYRHDALIAAHKTLPFGTVVRVTNLNNGKTTTVTIRDRGPYIEGRIIDLSSAAFERLAPIGSGTFKTRIEW